MAATEEELEVLRTELLEKKTETEKQGEVVRALKGNKVDKKEIEEALQLLMKLKLEVQAKEKEITSKAAGSDGKGNSKESFRQQLNDTLTSRLFFIPAFKIYGGVAGLYDYGPPGCAIKANVLALWRQHYVLEESMLEIDCPCVTPEIVLKASGHVDKFTDFMVKDEKTGMCYRADHLLKDYCTEALEKDPLLTSAKRQELKEVLTTLDELNAAQLGEKIKEYKITAPDSKNPVSDPYPFNLMFSTSIGPSGNAPGFLRPETAQGIFVNFSKLYYYNGNKLPFAAAQIGQAFRNEIAPRQGLLRVREFTLAEIEHFVDPEDKSHPKFKDVADLEFLLYPRKEQLSMEKPVKTRIGDAVSQGVVNNETLGYFIARTYLFLTSLGIQKDRLRFRQHLPNEMAHYAADCWDAEIECSYGWIEVTGLADRSAYDLKAHSDKSNHDLSAFEKYAESKVFERLKITPHLKLLGPAFKKDGDTVGKALLAMSEEEALDMKAKLEADGQAPLEVCTTGKTFTIKKEQVSISKETVTEAGRKFTPAVIEPSFGIGRIIYCMYEHCFYTRPSKGGDEQLVVFKFPPIVAPIKCTVFPLIQNEKLNVVAKDLSVALTRAGVANKIDITGTSIGKRYARTDELGVPFAITVDFETDVTNDVTLRERDSRAQVRVPLKLIASVVRDISEGHLAWLEVLSIYPNVAPSQEE
ncbi:glycyl-tRNA synthetase [Marchantia polymorpha subsp. ruderalis]|uniref:glycine--tRNA ligase n=2 Tax=Marchantia polymorpha TaxID=3197 RepID=A0A176WKK4_MARPO|nr:hypothetical protein AXG93_2852s1130 [Marchantia polymorpha subsp. ruderalis]PTQ49140.1 hypothetical protein MARPO_0003s0044 [Marchantia polymorpha]BBN16899.1 hypothetical protein Mp_7g10240 [Marchantia polymorpha subsp. ruderalis]|eukprot:PTQ49140.1 hypothetical protein MARPO_0003s0044 [Marchantia polymorpha]